MKPFVQSEVFCTHESLHKMCGKSFLFRHKWTYNRKEALENKFKNEHDDSRPPKLKYVYIHVYIYFFYVVNNLCSRYRLSVTT